jgi:colicin import membrane protein
MAQLKEQSDSVASLQNAVQNAKDDAARAAAQAQLDEAKRQQEATKGALNRTRPSGGGGGGGGTKPNRPACNCTPGDPLCSCIP